MKSFPLFIILFFLFSCKGRYYRAGSGSMEGTIMTGDRFLVMPADSFERNDIIVFDYFGPDYSSPLDKPGEYKMKWQKYVFRVIAYSGDSVEVHDDEVFVNSKHIPLPPKGKMPYQILSKVPIEGFEEKHPYGDFYPIRIGDTSEYYAHLTEDEVLDYRQRKPAVISVKRKKVDMGYDTSQYARASQTDAWTINNYGPLRIPVPGEMIVVDSINSKFYSNIPGIKSGNNLLQEKLYFVLGDNRYGAQDSRYIGLISHSNIKGVVK